MAVTLDSYPTGQIGLSDAVRFCLSIDSDGVPPESKKIVYRLYCVEDGVDVVPQSSIKAYGNQVCLDFNEDVKAFLETEFPVPAPAVVNSPHLRKRFRLDYGEAVFNSDTCESTVTMNQSSPEIWVVNSYKQYGDTQLFNSDGALLSRRPEKYQNVYNSNDAIWVIGTGSVRYEYWLQDGSSGVTNVSIPFNGAFVPLSPKFLGLPQTVVRIQAEITVGSTTKTYDIIIKDECDNNYAQFYWLEPLGSYSTLPFEIIQGGGYGQFTRINQGDKYQNTFQNSGSEEYTLYNASKKIKSIEGGEDLTLRATLPGSEELRRWLSTIGVARDSYLVVADADGSDINVRCQIADSSIKVYEKELVTITFNIKIPYLI